MHHIHLVGIGGIGLSAIARVLHAWGYQVSGSDVQPSTLTKQLETEGIDVYIGHQGEQMRGADLVIMSSAVRDDNPEVLAARQSGIPVLHRTHVLGEMMADRYGIAVAGTHGKTTTTALISFVLAQLGLDPTCIVGGVMNDTGSNARVGNGPYFVVEADEYDRTFLGLRPKLAVVTIVEMDHPDCFASLADVEQAFCDFADTLPDDGILVGGFDCSFVRELVQRSSQRGMTRTVGYGLAAGCDWTARGIAVNAWGGNDFDAVLGGRVVARASIRLTGVHNVCNALAVLATAHSLGLDLQQVTEALGRFTGVQRRFELKGIAGDVVVIDDYAHHPTEIRATLEAARRRYGKRPIWVVFQPHTFSRTRSLLDEFAASFADADHVIVTDIYAARETDDGAVHARDIVARMRHADARYIASLREAVSVLVKNVRPGEVVLTLGAGNGNIVGEKLLALLPDEVEDDKGMRHYGP